MSPGKDLWRISVLADKEVLTKPGLGVLKCVAADYDAAACVLRNPHSGPQRYFG